MEITKGDSYNIYVYGKGNTSVGYGFYVVGNFFIARTKVVYNEYSESLYDEQLDLKEYKFIRFNSIGFKIRPSRVLLTEKDILNTVHKHEKKIYRNN